MWKFPLTSWSFLCNCHSHCDTLQYIVCVASVCLGNETGCRLLAIWLASKCCLGKCGEREKYRVSANVFFFSTLFLFKTMGKFKILNNAQKQMQQLSQKSNFNSERLPLHFSTGTWGTCMLSIASVVLSWQIFPQEMSSFKELRCCKMGVLHLAVPWQILPVSWEKRVNAFEALQQHFQSKGSGFQWNTC